jgi:hypothetical protein
MVPRSVPCPSATGTIESKQQAITAAKDFNFIETAPLEGKNSDSESKSK